MVSNKKNTIYLISYLDERSLNLAESIRKNDLLDKKRATIIFTNISSDKSIYNGLDKKAQQLKCKLSSEDICNISLKKRSPHSLTRMVLIHPDENTNLNVALSLAEQYRDKITAEIYVFASSKESECLLDSVDKGGQYGVVPPLKIRRVNVVRNQIYTDLLNHSMFADAIEEYNEKIISVLIVGLGHYGMEMLKSVLWCGQMVGYVLKVTVIDESSDAEDLFYMQCPGIRERGTQPQNGEDYYEITFHSGINVYSETFYNIIRGLPNTTQVFVALGDERKSLETAMTLRTIFSGMKIDEGKTPSHAQTDTQKPRITAVVYNDQKARLLNQNKLANFKGQYYDIKCMASNEELYSFNNIFASELEEMALSAHLQWGDLESFNNYEYCRRSSMASAVHKKYRDELLKDNEELAAMAEHTRWNAYMRAVEGYSFGYVRDDLALRHSSLIKYSSLAPTEKAKDHRMNSYEIINEEKKGE